MYLKLKFAAAIADVKTNVLEKLKHVYHQPKVENRVGQNFRAEGLFCVCLLQTDKCKKIQMARKNIALVTSGGVDKIIEDRGEPPRVAPGCVGFAAQVIF